ncbi:hypothetical protein IWZ03DRAFT_371972 [Phyllosticta citriasiana]|uniref:Uncharacterized protein n=1 Tax=Phyllosticta citriasiana TaxID=595635 RepID=A0ABR1KR53_9PEZI
MLCSSSSSSSPAVDRSNNLCQTARGPNASRCGNLLRASTLFFLSPLVAAGVASAATAGDGAGATCMYMHASRPGAQVTGLRWRRRRRGMVRSREGWERALMRVVGWLASWLAGWLAGSVVCATGPPQRAGIHTHTYRYMSGGRLEASERLRKRSRENLEAKDDKEARRRRRRCATSLTPHIQRTRVLESSSSFVFCLSSPVQPDEAKEACRLLGACM